MSKVRINKYLSESRICSRRKADEHILTGDVTVNSIKAKLGDKIDPSNDVIRFKGKKVCNSAISLYYALYKPKGIISTSDDELNRKSVTDFLPKESRVYPIGRLDKDSEGLIILTNDGELTNKLSHPKFLHEKEYSVIAETRDYKIENNVKHLFETGLKIDDTLMKADRVYNVLMHGAKLKFKVILHTGHNRQIRRMCDKIGLEVKKLIRVRIGKLRLKDLKLEPGQYKIISKSDII